jgi:hypothetical protein
VAERGVRIEMDQIAIRRMLRSPTGAVGRRMILRGQAIAKRAKELAPEGMREGISSDWTGNILGTTVIIRSTHPATVFVVKGTKAHRVTAHGDYSLHNSATGAYFGRSVWIPKKDANDFLGKAMEEVGI